MPCKSQNEVFFRVKVRLCNCKLDRICISRIMIVLNNGLTNKKYVIYLGTIGGTFSDHVNNWYYSSIDSYVMYGSDFE